MKEWRDWLLNWEKIFKFHLLFLWWLISHQPFTPYLQDFAGFKCFPGLFQLTSSCTKCLMTKSLSSVQFSSVAQLCPTLRPPCPSPSPGVHSDSCPSSPWCHPAIPSSVIPFSSCPQFLPASESFPMSQHFAWGGQSTGVSASASVLPMNPRDWSSLGWTGWISLQSKGLSRVFSKTTVQKYQFFGTQPSSQPNSQSEDSCMNESM